MKRLNTASSRSSVIVLFVGGAIILLSSFMLYGTFAVEGYQRGGRPLGEISFFEKSVRRKDAGQVIWERVSRHMTVYEGDYISTGDDSFATLSLSNGSMLELDEESMIIVSSGAKGMEIDFRFGTVLASSTGGKGGITLRSGDSSIVLDQSRATLRGGDDGRMKLNVTEGNAEVVTGDKRLLVTERQMVTMVKGGSDFAVKEIPLVALSPPDNYFVTLSENRISFSWDAPGKEKKVFLELRRRGGEILKIKARGGRAARKLAAGTWYWQVVQGKNRTEPRRLTVARIDPPQLLYPGRGSRFSLSGDDLLSFRWKAARQGENYYLIIKGEGAAEGFSRRIHSFTPGIAVEKMPDGKYLWQVRAEGRLGSFAYKKSSPWRTFQVATLERVSPPVLIYPLEGWTGSRSLFQESRVLFAWTFKRPGATFVWELAGDREFSRVLQKRKTAAMKVTESFTLPVGEYFWRVSVRLPSREAPIFSGVQTLRVVEQKPLRLDEPRDRHVFYQPAAAKKEQISFAWEGGMIQNYRFELFRGREAKEPVHSARLDTGHYSLDGLNRGSYSWRVSLLDREGRVLEKSRLNSFSIVPVMQRPLLIFPQRNMTVDMQRRNSLRFIWHPVAGADYYYFTLSPGKDRDKRPVVRRRVRGTIYELRDLSLLSEGGFSWRVVPVSIERIPGGSHRTGPPAEQSFSLTLGPPLEKPEIISPRLQYGEKK